MIEKTKYSKADLKEFERLIQKNLTEARERLNKLKISMAKENEDITTRNASILNDNVEMEQRDNLTQLITHQEKYISSLERAQQRVNKGTYGICVVTGKLISKQRLCAVPHTTHSVEAKKQRISPSNSS